MVFRYYAVILVKIKLTFKKKSTKLYNNFRTYEEAEYNIPYVTAVLSKSIIRDEFFNLTLGKHTFNEVAKVTNCSVFIKCLDLVKYVSLFNKLK